jgi:hypothetical protein
MFGVIGNKLHLTNTSVDHTSPAHPISAYSGNKSNLRNDDEGVLQKLADMSSKYGAGTTATTTNPTTTASESIKPSVPRDLDTFLRANNIVDGNNVQTRRIDLRSCQQMSPADLQATLNPARRVESFFQKILTASSSSPDENAEHGDDDDEEDDDDGEAGNETVFERYRRQRAMAK